MKARKGKRKAKPLAGDLKTRNFRGPKAVGRRPSRAANEELRPRNIGHSLARIKGGDGPWERKQHHRGQTVTVSFTITPEVDQIISQLAIDMGRSRSAVIRQMSAHYASCEKVKRGLQGE